MTFPAVLDTTSTPNTATATTGTVIMPATIVAGQLLCAHVFSGQTQTASAGWTLVGATATTSVFAKSAVGGDILTVTFGASSSLMAITYRVSGWSGSVVDIGYALAAGTLNPPSLTMPASADYLWLVGARNTFAAPTVPTSYSGLVSVTAGGVYLATAQRNRTIATEDPATFGGAANGANSYTVGVPPAAPARTSDFFPFFT